ncbi:MAG: Fe-S cluster assembly protein NifU [Candidatus Thiodiazotropha lotti]|uniref:Nitrogen fixation protein NifU n=1 Tax=Candidatus Thiodiazotropha endoloripes TaxID=1818881 RepID=A0A1E2UTG5_9GAMM|nr:Fe-S cluster assembly protein NifU [Candidatus Thiodiazotropha endoloripes]MCG7900162.1 Fe-S cluster assembly protein NifU [Candidatus Thiodiazotropha weberae]MCG7990675.1 Fe-S cluster assembly protein NifU [Candidatus Thiodiazotropha lotti]MCG7901315.1 Fe-S cluster assembly protein NifU [Candidatus Thiodiazotropha weberae]MCG7915809.1 Fe-S cluster assembly protein NifU [Candidatus Thiodiazotropha weberae]MCG7999460.1 Fe-S cluster assembly protein NifU [Candidatus Thiodiazotropha lotti]
MWDYSEKVQEHFFSPRNAGAVDDANAIGDVGSLSCGDALRLTLKVDPDSEVILDAGFQTFGCGSAIASSSALTEIIKGMKIDDALGVSNQDIADYLDGLPPEKMHCSVMGREALQAAVANYRGEEWKDDHEEGALICKCFAIDEVMIEETVRANGLRTVEEVTNYTKAGGGCSACHEGIEEILTRILAEKGETFDPNAVAGEIKKPKSGLTNLQRMKRIEELLDEIRPNLQRDHGDVELVEVDGRYIYVKMIGACAGCQMAATTLGGIQQHLAEGLGEFIQVLPAEELARRAAMEA